MIGVVGGYGAVGRATCAALSRWGYRPGIGGRDAAAAAELARQLPGAHARPVDLADPRALADFAADCEVLVNCAGPAAQIGDTVARAAAAAGVGYVDAAGDDRLYQQVGALNRSADWRAVISAGMMPGLTGLLPRALAAEVAAPRRLTGWVGGRDRFTRTAAYDYLASFTDFGAALAGWRDGRRVSGAAVGGTGQRAPYFPDEVSLTGYLSTEAERLAARLGLAEATWYSVFAGPHAWQALTAADSADVVARADRLSRAADLDLFGARPYQLIVVELAGDDGCATLALRAAGASVLTGITAAIAARALCDPAGPDVPAGVHHAADVLDPRQALTLLRECPEVPLVELRDGPAWQELEVGAL